MGGEGLDLLDHDGAHNRDTNFPGVIGLEPPLAGQMAEVVIHIASVRIGQFKLNPRQRLLCDRIQFADHQISGFLVIEAEDVRPAVADFDGLGGAVQHHAFRYLDLPCYDRSTGLYAGDDHPAILTGDELAVAVADYGSAAVRDQEGDALQRLVLAALLLDILFDDQGVLRDVVKVHALVVSRIHHNGLALTVFVN